MTWPTFIVVYMLAAFGLAYICGHALITRDLRERLFNLFANKRVKTICIICDEPGLEDGLDLPTLNKKCPTPGCDRFMRQLERISRPFHWLVLLVECPACFGFWIGLTVGWFGSRSTQIAVVAALVTTSTNFLLGRATGLIARPGER